MDLDKLTKRAQLAADWLADIAQKREAAVGIEDLSQHFFCTNWGGAIRTMYWVASGRWQLAGGAWWHTGQAVKGLVLAHKLLGHDKHLQAARRGVEFLLRSQIQPPDDNAGLIVAEEDVVPKHPHHASTSSQLESLAGLLAFADATGEDRPRQAALDALDWISRKMYAGGGYFPYYYDLQTHKSVRCRDAEMLPPSAAGRPLLDDAMFLVGSRLAGRDDWRRIFFDTADRLLADGSPPQNWNLYSIPGRTRGATHPRNPYWWGLPMLDAYEESGRREYLEHAIAAGQWYERAVRRDGGLIRGTYEDGSTDSFGHATSGAACAVIFWRRLWKARGETKYVPLMARSLEYCMNMQFTRPQDPNLRGAVLEKVLPPDGTDRSPYEIRDLGTIFFLQAAGTCLLDGDTRSALENAL